jgi:glutathione S-transferase
MPVLEDDGYVLWESNAIVEYLAAKTPAAALMPEALRPRLQIAKWLYWESAHWDQACAFFMFERVVKPLFGLGEACESEIARGTLLFNRLAAVLDGELHKHRFVAGETLTAADLAIAAPLCLAERARLPLEPYRAIQHWQADIQALPAWSKTVAMQG